MAIAEPGARSCRTFSFFTDAQNGFIFNIFPCMGLYDKNGQVKDGVTDIWQDALP
ncbi:MAG: hypothetical protein JSV31_29050 [Desulfobacterales bacterium]|nr:MAG: hypothetical protein JSV31_29050 [Desulfobacterales bacterium]